MEPTVSRRRRAWRRDNMIEPSWRRQPEQSTLGRGRKGEENGVSETCRDQRKGFARCRPPVRTVGQGAARKENQGRAVQGPKGEIVAPSRYTFSRQSAAV